MQMEHKRLEDTFDHYEEIIIDKDHEHIYGYEDGEAVEIEEPKGPLYDVKRAMIEEMVFIKGYWKRTHHSEFEDRFLKSRRNQ